MHTPHRIHDLLRREARCLFQNYGLLTSIYQDRYIFPPSGTSEKRLESFLWWISDLPAN